MPPYGVLLGGRMMGISGLLRQRDNPGALFRLFGNRNANAGDPRAVDGVPRPGNR